MASPQFESIVTNGGGSDSVPWLVPKSRQEPQISPPLRPVSMADVVEEKVSWLWEPYLPLGTFTLMEGAEGLGKTFVACALSTAVGLGSGLPGVPRHIHMEPGNVLLVSAEDSLSFVLKPRLASMGAPMDKIFALDEAFTLDPDGIDRFGKVLDELRPKLAIIDPLFSYTGRINLNNDNEIRTITDALKRLAEQYHCTILGIRHIGKNKGMGDVRNAGLNGVGWRASARSVLMIGQDPDNPKVRAICHTKSNYGPISDKSMGYEIVDGQFYWTGESHLSAETMLSFSRVESTEERGERTDAMQFLKETLKSGRTAAKDVQAAARHAGHSDATVRRAKTALGVKSVKDEVANGVWFWELPRAEGAQVRPIHSIDHLQSSRSLEPAKTLNQIEGAQDAQPAHQGELDHLREHVLAITGEAMGEPYGKCRCGAHVFIDKPCPKCHTVARAAA